MTQQRSKGWRRARTDADRWNAKHKVGTPVRYYSVEGDAAHVVTTTRSDAFETRQGVMIFQVRTELEKHFGDLVRGLEKAIGRLA